MRMDFSLMASAMAWRSARKSTLVGTRTVFDAEDMGRLIEGRGGRHGDTILGSSAASGLWISGPGLGGFTGLRQCFSGAPEVTLSAARASGR